MSGLVLVTASDSRPARLAEFRAAARRIAGLWGEDTRMVAVDRGEDIARAIERHEGDLTRLAICCHGWSDRLLARGRGVRVAVQRPPGTISVEYLAQVLSGVAGDSLRVALACCSCASDPGLAGWLSGGRSYGPGGYDSLASYLHRWLRHRGVCATVLGHSTPGHATRNPALREWSPGGQGLSVLDRVRGDGAHRDRRERGAWVDWCREEIDGVARAEYVLAGVPIPTSP